MNPETFENFMRRCLHDPERGYYSRNIRTIGAKGDFTTAPQLSDAPAKAIAAWVARAMKSCRTRNLIEIGPGLGTLSVQVLSHLPFPLRFRTKLHLVESSPTLAELQKTTLGPKAEYHQDIRAALERCSGNAVIFSNELVDAFPVRLFQNTESGWREITLDHSHGQTREILSEPDRLPRSTSLDDSFPPGQRVEVHESYRLWLEEWLPSWKRGEILTIDYGGTAETLYHRRPSGTLRAYLLHQRLEGPAIYQNQGLQDLTADVNFSDLADWSHPWLESSTPESFADFIRPFSPPADTRLLEACSHFTCLRQTRRSA